MKKRIATFFLVLVPLLLVALSPSTKASESCPPLLEHSYKKLNSSEDVNLCETLKGQVVLVVNTASQCGYTPQFKQLESLYQTYKDRGFTVVGFPSNDFYQDRGSEAETAKVCYINYGVTFPMMEKTKVRGADSEGIFRQLADTSGVEPKWNFYKYLLDRDGKVIGVFPSNSEPMSATFQKVVEAAL
ncbi:glutathione peroxidase [Veronia nyctiphanis]|uniref:Glutathione peroxidase n=1 Tax=Veronia nyctiphanis TaxID=1278244 RepID=A0A4Q0YC01_9GAMM|nr:glutathione peroxidase [Veronia nyctiphanis]RXJ67886.1 glutathione peroxidase [Veronia nyctiphanis]